jgi:hypothetical protein
MLTCVECSCISDEGEGWLAFLAQVPDDDDGPDVATYCPPCADREIQPVEDATAYE